MTDDSSHLILLPLPESSEEGAQRFAWWKSVDGKCVQHGESDAVRVAAGLSDDAETPSVTLLLPADICVVRMHQLADMTAPQAEVAARIAALENSIGDNGDLHAAALVTGSEETDGETQHHVQTAVVARSALQPLLDGCHAMDLDPDHIHPAALVVPGDSAECFRFAIGPYQFLRTPDLAAEDDPVLSEMLIGESECVDIADDAVVAALGTLPMRTLPDLRHGDFAKKVERALFGEREKRILIGMTLALVLVTLLIPALRWMRYSSATDSVVSETIAKAKEQLPGVTDLASADIQVDAALLARRAGPRIFTAPSAALFSTMQKVDNITIRDLGYRPDGTLTAVVAAPDNATMNQLLIPLQEQGYIITATQRAEAGGASVIDLTVRG